MLISMKELSGSDVLARSEKGREVFGRLIAKLRPASEPETCYLDFGDVSLATASFLREAVVAFRDYCRSSHPNLYPIIANLSPATMEELELLLKTQNEALVVATLKAN